MNNSLVKKQVVLFYFFFALLVFVFAFRVVHVSAQDAAAGVGEAMTAEDDGNADEEEEFFDDDDDDGGDDEDQSDEEGREDDDGGDGEDNGDDDDDYEVRCYTNEDGDEVCERVLKEENDDDDDDEEEEEEDDNAPSERSLTPKEFALLTDRPSLEAFHDILKSTITSKSVVLDLYTKVGAHAVMAAKLGSQQIIAMEGDDFLLDLAREVAEENNVTEPIVFVNQLEAWTDFNASVVLISHLPGFLIDGGVINTLASVETFKIKQENAVVIPRRARLTFRLVQTNYKLDENKHDVGGVSLKALEKHRLYGNPISEDGKEKLVSKYLSEPFKAFEFDFQQVHPAPHNYTTFPITITHAGQFHGILVSWEADMSEGFFAGKLKSQHDSILLSGQDNVVVAAGEVLLLSVAIINNNRFLFTTDRFDSLMVKFVNSCGEPMVLRDENQQLVLQDGEETILVAHVGGTFQASPVDNEDDLRNYSIGRSKSLVSMAEYVLCREEKVDEL